MLCQEVRAVFNLEMDHPISFKLQVKPPMLKTKEQFKRQLDLKRKMKKSNSRKLETHQEGRAA